MPNRIAGNLQSIAGESGVVDTDGLTEITTISPREDRAVEARSIWANSEDGQILPPSEADRTVEIPRRAADITPYDLKLNLLSELITGITRSGDDYLIADDLVDLADQFVSILEKRRMWLHFREPGMPMPCPEFLIPPVDISVEG